MRDQVEKIIRGGGAILLRHFGTTVNGNDKAFKGDIESDADRETEQHLVQGFRSAFPGDAVMTEEHPTYTESTNGRLWIIDALDGSRNFVSRIPLFGISIALVEKGQVQFGMVYLPLQDELFWASRGAGAYCNGKKIMVSTDHDLENIRIPFMPHYHRSDEKHIQHINQQLMRYKVWQLNPGNLVVPLCYTACGRLEGTITIGVHVWDVAGSNIIVEEAGGIVTDLQGRPWDWRSDHHDVVAANPVLHEKIMREIIN